MQLALGQRSGRPRQDGGTALVGNSNCHQLQCAQRHLLARLLKKPPSDLNRSPLGPLLEVVLLVLVLPVLVLRGPAVCLHRREGDCSSALPDQRFSLEATCSQ